MTQNCTQGNINNNNYISINNNCFIRDIWNTCVKDYASARCGPQTECLAQKLFAIDTCYNFIKPDTTYDCGACNDFSYDSNPLKTVDCVAAKEQNGSSIPTASLTFLFLITLVFQLFGFQQ